MPRKDGSAIGYRTCPTSESGPELTVPRHAMRRRHGGAARRRPVQASPTVRRACEAPGWENGQRSNGPGDRGELRTGDWSSGGPPNGLRFAGRKVGVNVSNRAARKRIVINGFVRGKRDWFNFSVRSGDFVSAVNRLSRESSAQGANPHARLDSVAEGKAGQPPSLIRRSLGADI